MSSIGISVTQIRLCMFNLSQSSCLVKAVLDGRTLAAALGRSPKLLLPRPSKLRDLCYNLLPLEGIGVGACVPPAKQNWMCQDYRLAYNSRTGIETFNWIVWFGTTHGNHLPNHTLYLLDEQLSNSERTSDSLYLGQVGD
jgi:hypothetical protein